MNPCTRVFSDNGKVNFVDTNNVLVGFDDFQSCCESYGWFFSGDPESVMQDSTPYGTTLEGWVFDPGFCFNHVTEGIMSKATGPDGEGGSVVFRLVHADGSPGYLYLHIYNHHNGYYSHGFTVDAGGIRIADGSI